jgi:hypothetical protein
MAVIMSRQMTIPLTGKLLSDYAHGEIVKINENGKPVEFYVAKHDYESGLNGAGRTLLVRRLLCSDSELRSFNSSGENKYASGNTDIFLNGEYKSRLDVDVQEAIGTTKFKYTPSGNTSNSVTTLSRCVFILSATEWGYTLNYANVEGEVIPIYKDIIVTNTTYENNTSKSYSTRSPNVTSSKNIIMVNAMDDFNHITTCTKELNVRPAFTLPGASVFDPDTNEFKKVI